MFILQNESKMKAALGQKVQFSLPKAFQTSKAQNKRLTIKGVPTDITETEFKKFLDLNIKSTMPRLNDKKLKKTAGSCQSLN